MSFLKFNESSVKRLYMIHEKLRREITLHAPYADDHKRCLIVLVSTRESQ